MNTGNQCPFGSVGALIERDGAYLMLYRTASNPGLAGIAGHIDAGESPEDALRRELKEEAGIEAGEMELVLHTTLPNPCKKGYASHEWWVYKVTAWSGEPTLMEPDKHAFVKFVSLDDIRGYAQHNDMDPAWQMILRDERVCLISQS